MICGKTGAGAGIDFSSKFSGLTKTGDRLKHCKDEDPNDLTASVYSRKNKLNSLLICFGSGILYTRSRS
jgi:hypothetical protein